MSNDFNWNAPVRWPFRIAGGLLGLIGVLYGLGALAHGIIEHCWDSLTKSGIPPLFFGVIFIIAAIRGRVLPKRILPKS